MFDSISVLFYGKTATYSATENRDKAFKNILEVFPFFDLIAECKDFPARGGKRHYCIVAKEENWFWLDSNEPNRTEFLDDLKTEDFIKIATRYKDGDAYGIVKPVPRNEQEKLDTVYFKEACDYYSKYSNLKHIIKDLFKEHGYKLIYCWQNQKPFSDFHGWVTCEVMLNQPINFGEYKVVDEVFYGTPKEILQIYGTSEYFQTVELMKAALLNRAENLSQYKEDMISKMVEAELFGEYRKLKELFKELRSLYEPPEGSGTARKRVLNDRFKEEVLEKIPADVVQVIKSLLGGILYG
ncbi:MAG: hypothetical protein UGF89_12795 [Acutalibacteraceae bacterium]|nr:hypothetical protein [Acutalibacteraceae bacterium]